MAYVYQAGDSFIKGAGASGLVWGAVSVTPPFQPTIVVPSANPVLNILNPGHVNKLNRKKYQGYYNDNLSFFNTARLLNTVQEVVYVDEGIDDNYTMMWTGYIYAPSWGDYVIETVSDDSSMVWVGDKAISGWTVENADVNNGGLHGSMPKDTLPNVLRMESGWYPIRIIFGEATGNAHMSMRLYKYGATVDEYISLANNTATAEGFNP